MEEGKVKSPYIIPLNPAQRYAAYTAGQNDAAVSLNREKGGVAYGPVRSEEAGLVPNDLVKSLPKNAARFLDALGKSAGVKIELVDRIVTPDGTDGGNGSYDPRKGVLTISLNAEGVQRANGEINLQALCTVAAHEITHRIQQLAPEQYRAYRDYAVSVVGERFGGTEGAVAAKGRQYAARGVTLSAQEAMDEIAADFTEALVAAPGRFEALVRADRGVAGRILDAIIDFIAKVKAFFSGKKTRDTTAFGVEFSALEEAALLWQKAHAAAAAAAGSVKNTGADGIIEGKRFSTKAQRGRSIEQETMENNRFERLRQFGEDIPDIWYAYTADHVYLYRNYSYTDYKVLDKRKITDENSFEVEQFEEEIRNGTYTSAETLDRWASHFRRRKGCNSLYRSRTGNAGTTGRHDGVDV